MLMNGKRMKKKKKKKHLVALTSYISFERKAEKYSVSCATARVQF
jgi:hypothetical protein